METHESSEINTEATKERDNVAFKAHHVDVPSIVDIQEMMRQRLEHECASIDPLRKEMDKLAHAYHRYVDLKGEIDSRSKRIQRIIGVLGDEYLQAMCGSDENYGRRRPIQEHVRSDNGRSFQIPPGSTEYPVCY